MTVVDFLHELALVVYADHIDARQRFAAQLLTRWGLDFKAVAEILPEAELGIAADWLLDRGTEVSARILRTWDGLDSIEGFQRSSGLMELTFMLTDKGFVYACSGHGRHATKRKWARGSKRTVPLITVGTMVWRRYDSPSPWPNGQHADGEYDLWSPLLLAERNFEARNGLSGLFSEMAAELLMDPMFYLANPNPRNIVRIE